MKPSNTTLSSIVGAALLALLVALDAVYVVTETNQAIITQFGEPMGGAITKPGLHLKTPFVQKTHFFEKRWLEWDGDPNQIPTKDKKYVWVDTYCRWRISDPLVFFQRVRDERGAHSRLDDIVDGETRNVVANYDLIEIVRSTNRAFEVTEDAALLDYSDVVGKIQTGREHLAKLILEKRLEDHPGVRRRDQGRPDQAGQLRGRGPGQGLRPDDRRAQADRRQVPLRGRRQERRDPGPEGARAASGSSPKPTGRPRKPRARRTPRRRGSTPRRTASTRNSTSSYGRSSPTGRPSRRIRRSCSPPTASS